MTWLPGFEMGSLAYIGVFLGILLVFEGVRQTVTRSESLADARSRRMRMIAAGASTEDLLRILNPDRSGWRLAQLPLIGDLPSDLRKAGLTVSAGFFLSICLGAALVLAVVGSTLVLAPVAIALAVLLCVVIPILWVQTLRKRRMAALVQQLPEALELMARGLTVGHPLNATIASVATKMSDPVATEFGIIVDQVSYGDDLVDAVNSFAERTGLEDVHYLAVSIGIQHGTGGNLAEILNTLSKVIRDRMAMRRRIKAISAEGRLTALFLSVLPLVILTGVSITAPDYYPGVANDPAFKPVAAVVVSLIVANFLVLRKLVNFRF